MSAKGQQSSKNQLLSLFCGSGGLDYGFTCAGFETILALDNNPDAVSTFNANFEGNVAREKDLSCLKPDEFLSLIPSSAKPIGMIGGPPCQGFSRGNVFADAKDPRNRLPYRFADLLAAVNRKYEIHFFVFENVAGLVGPKHIARFKSILHRFRAAGFNINYAQLNAIDFAVPQRRRRLFIVGLNSKIYGSRVFQFPLGKLQMRTVHDAIAGLPEPKYFQRNLDPETIPYHPNHWTMVPKSPKFTSGILNSGRSFRRLAWDDASPTVAYGNREVHVHPDGGRRLSVLEAMLLQGFPIEYRILGSLSSQITQVSNAVPPPIASSIATNIRVYLRGNTPASSGAVLNPGK